MAQKVTVFVKQSGEAPYPVTARIGWLPDGSIKPLMYWTPDGYCFRVAFVHEMIELALLKDRGEGLRYKVRSVAAGVPDLHSDYLLTQHETYLFFADNWFCGKNFVDARYGHGGKIFIPVTMDVFPGGGYELVYFWVQGTRYIVEKTIMTDNRGSYHAGGVGVWHKVKARTVNACDDEDPDPNKSVHRIAALYFEINKWFVSLQQANDNQPFTS